MKTKENNNKLGFTLIELAISIVLIGLIIGGIVGARSLITSAKRNTFISELSKFHTSVKAFELEYNGLPGDFTEADQYWGTATNGNGNDMIDTDAESHQVWFQLNLAQIYPGTFSGVGGANYTAGVNAPKLPYDGTVAAILSLSAYAWGDGSVITNRFKPREVGVVVFPDGLTVDGGDDLNTTTITPMDGKYLDEKLDDGHPANGKMISVACDDSGEMEWQGFEDQIVNVTAYDLTGTDNCSSIISLDIIK